MDTAMLGDGRRVKTSEPKSDNLRFPERARKTRVLASIEDSGPPNAANRAIFIELKRLAKPGSVLECAEEVALTQDAVERAKCAIHAIDRKGLEVSKVIPAPSGEAFILRFTYKLQKITIDLQGTPLSWQWIVIQADDTRKYHKAEASLNTDVLLDQIEASIQG